MYRFLKIFLTIFLYILFYFYLNSHIASTINIHRPIFLLEKEGGEMHVEIFKTQ